MSKKSPRFNRQVDGLIASASWYMDPEWGRMQLVRYLDDLEMAQAHGLKSLGYRERKEAASAQVLVPTGAMTPLGAFTGENGVAVLQLSGVMQSEDGLSTRGIRSLVSEIQAVYDHPGIVGMVLDVNSGGGEVTAAGMLKSALTNAPKPVVVLAHFMASGALYGTLPVKDILAADAFSVIGSIGTVYSLDKQLAAWYKENVDDIYAPSSSEKGEEWRAYLAGDPSKYAAKAEEFAQAFAAEVIRFRGLNKQQQDKALKGRIFVAADALSLNLLTGFGTLRDAIQMVRDRATGASVSNHNPPIMFKGLVQQLNRLFSLSLAEDATADQISAALAGVASVADLQTSLTDLTAKVQALDGFEARLAAVEGRADLTARVTAVETAQTAADTAFKTLSATVNTHDTSIKSLETALADGTMADTRPGGSAVPGGAIKEFTEKLEAATASGDSKY